MQDRLARVCEAALGRGRARARLSGRQYHHIAICDRRILAFNGETVTFSWRDYAGGNEHNAMSLPTIEFLRRFAMHIVPPHFTRMRYYGFLADGSAVGSWRGPASTRTTIRLQPALIQSCHEIIQKTRDSQVVLRCLFVSALSVT